jgi:toxin-antitoxin system PIN domain toxin
MIAVDTNILVYAHRADSEWHEVALEKVLSLARGTSRWAIPWPCVHEFIAICTHPRIYVPPSPLALALDALEEWFKSPRCVVVGEGPEYFGLLRDLCEKGRVSGGAIHDARIAAICMHHGVTELWSADRDFGRFAGLRVTNPLLA